MANKPLKSIKFPGLNDTYTVPEVDATLATTGAAADAKKVGDEINDLKADLNQIFSDNAKDALLNCFAHTVFTDDDSDYYGILRNALYADAYPRITAIFNPGTHHVYHLDSLDTLKPYLTVKYYETSTSAGTVVADSDYTLSGNLVEGDQTITVSYLRLVATFVVNVTNPFIYRLPNTPVEFDGTNYVDTGVALLNEDRSFTIAFDFTDNKNYYNASSMNLVNGMPFGCRMSSSPYNGMFWNFYDAGSQPNDSRKVRMNMGCKPSGSFNFEQVYSSREEMIGRRVRGIFQYDATNHTINTRLSVNGTELQPYTTPTTSANLDAGNITNPLTIGTRMPISGSEYLIGVMNDFKVFDSVISDADATAYIEGVA